MFDDALLFFTLVLCIYFIFFFLLFSRVAWGSISPVFAPWNALIKVDKYQEQERERERKREAWVISSISVSQWDASPSVDWILSILWKDERFPRKRDTLSHTRTSQTDRVPEQSHKPCTEEKHITLCWGRLQQLLYSALEFFNLILDPSHALVNLRHT